MSTTVQLPSSLRQRIAALAQRIRLLRAVRGLSLLILVLGLAAGAAMTADFLLDGALPDVVRRIDVLAWFGRAGRTTHQLRRAVRAPQPG
jgi:hypothetical protein